MSPIAPISQQIWDMKYRVKGPDGTPVDQAITDTWRRLAKALSAPEKNPAQWEERFYQALEDFRFLPAGRIVAGAGTARKVTLFNCFVMGTIPDDMSGIFEHLREAALTMQQGGGIGYDFSTLRPRGAPVKGVGADASGPLSFMDVWDAMCRTIMSAGHRRGAMMATLRCDHPDIEAFIEAKREPNRLRMFNLSVLVTDAFMQAVKQNLPWELTFKGTTYGTVQARELWDKIMRATYAYAEPGVIFIDRINRRNNLHYCETIAATNPCVTADTWIHTAEGPRQVRDLVGRPFTALVDGKAYESGPQGFFATGTKPVLQLRTRDGYNLRLTADHRVLKVKQLTHWSRDTEWVAAGELRPGDAIVIHDHRAAPQWQGSHTEAEGYLLGLLIGAGTLEADKAVLRAWTPRQAVNADATAGAADAVMTAALNAAQTLAHGSDLAGWMEVPGRHEWRLSLEALRTLAADFGLAPGNMAVTAAMEATSAGFHRGLLRGLFDTDGSVQGSRAKGVSIRLGQNDAATLEAVQRMLLRFGIVSTIWRNRRFPERRPMPDGKGGQKLHDQKLHDQKLHDPAAQHELVIADDNVLRFAERIGSADSDKALRLRNLLAADARRPDRERFVAEIEAVAADGSDAVYDVQIPGINAFDANGLYVHNCGEQPLPPYGACLLGSINLARLVTKPFEVDAALDLDALEDLTAKAVRMMDNTIDVSNFPLEAQAAEARAKRRIGLGVTGLADALIMVGARYGSARSIELIETWMKRLQRAAYLASVELAKEKGAFPLFDREAYLAGESIRELDADIRAAIEKHGIRNALLTSIAPTGTISLFADNVSSGLEPVFSFHYTRNVLMPDGTRREEEVSDYAYRLYRQIRGDGAPLTEAFVDAQVLSPADHVRVQAAVQKYVDSSISKTINVPEEIDFGSFKDIYLMAYEHGCKGCTTYRPNDVTGSVLQVKKEDKKAAAEAAQQPELPLVPVAKPIQTVKPRDPLAAGGVVYMTKPLDRPEALPGRTYKITWPDSEHAMYITLNDILQDGRLRPFEVFVNSKNTEHYAWTVALTRMISAVFRRGGDVSFVVDELKAVFDPRGGHWMNGRYVPSLLAAIGEVIEQHLIAIGFMADPNAQREEKATLALAANAETPKPLSGLRQCPKCGQPGLIKLEGCDTCTSCGYSKCS